MDRSSKVTSDFLSQRRSFLEANNESSLQTMLETARRASPTKITPERIDSFEFRPKSVLNDSLNDVTPAKGGNGDNYTLKARLEQAYGNHKHFRASGPLDFSGANTSGVSADTSSSSVHTPTMPFRPTFNSSFNASAPSPVDIDNAMANLQVGGATCGDQSRKLQVELKPSVKLGPKVLSPKNLEVNSMDEQGEKASRRKYISESSELDGSGLPTVKQVTYFHIIQ